MAGSGVGAWNAVAAGSANPTVMVLGAGACLPVGDELSVGEELTFRSPRADVLSERLNKLFNCCTLVTPASTHCDNDAAL